MTIEFYHKRDFPQQIFSCCRCQAGRQYVHSPSHSLIFLGPWTYEEKLMTKRDFVLAPLALPKPIRNSLIHRLIFVMWFAPLWICKECGTGNISMLISTVATKPCRPESIKSLLYLALELPLASIINYCKAHQKQTKTPCQFYDHLRDPEIDLWGQKLQSSCPSRVWKKRLQFKCSPSICSLFHCAPQPPCLM